MLGAQVLRERGAQNNSLEAGAGLCVSDFENPYVRQSAAARLRDVNARRNASKLKPVERRHKARAKQRIRGLTACAGSVREPVGPLFPRSV